MHTLNTAFECCTLPLHADDSHVVQRQIEHKAIWLKQKADVLTRPPKLMAAKGQGFWRGLAGGAVMRLLPS